MFLEFCVEKCMCEGNSWFKKKDNRRITFNGGCGETEIEFALMKGRRSKFLKNVRAIRDELQHRLLKVLLDRR